MLDFFLILSGSERKWVKKEKCAKTGCFDALMSSCFYSQTAKEEK